MSETEIKTVPTTEPEPAKEPMSDKEIMRLMQITDGKNPDAQQTINDFMKFDNDVERSNLPTTNAVLCITQLDVCDQWLYPHKPDNPFAKMKKALAIAFMARKGEKAQQFVDIVRNQPDLSQYQTAADDAKKSFTDRLFSRSVSE